MAIGDMIRHQYHSYHERHIAIVGLEKSGKHEIASKLMSRQISAENTNIQCSKYRFIGLDNFILWYGEPNYRRSAARIVCSGMMHDSGNIGPIEALLNESKANGVFWVIDGRNDNESIRLVVRGLMRRAHCSLVEEIVNICCNYYGNVAQQRLKKCREEMSPLMADVGKGMVRMMNRKAWCILINNFGSDNVLSLEEIQEYLGLDMSTAREIILLPVNSTNGDGLDDAMKWMKTEAFEMIYGR